MIALDISIWHVWTYVSILDFVFRQILTLLLSFFMDQKFDPIINKNFDPSSVAQ